MFESDVHCMRDRALGPKYGLTSHELFASVWEAVVEFDPCGAYSITYDANYGAEIEKIHGFLARRGEEIASLGRDYAYKTFDEGELSFAFVPLRPRDTGDGVAGCCFCKAGAPYTEEILNLCYYTSRLAYDLILTENRETQMTEFLNNVLDSGDIISIIFDLDFKVINMSSGALALYGPIEYVEPEKWSQLGFPAEIDLENYIRQVLHSERPPIRNEEVFLKKKHMVLEYSVSPFFNSQGVLAGGLIVGRDTTERRLYQYEAEQRSRYSVMGEIATMLLHDIKNPLMNISALAQYLERQGAAAWESYPEIAEDIAGEVGRITEIMNQMLPYTRMVESNISSEVNINVLLEQCTEMCGLSLKWKKLSVEMDLDKNLPTVIAVPMDFKYAFLRIMNNGIDAMEKGGTLKLATEYHPEQKEICVKISNNGKPILGEEKKNLFLPFFSTKKEGTGLGLYSTQKIVERYGGSISYSSEPGKDTVWQVLLPQERGN